jgi:AhpD family alkylhydroperoxidase
MESPTAVWNEYLKQRVQGAELMPTLIDAMNTLRGEAYKEGALSTKTKRLMALAVGMRAGCETCVVGQTMLALQAGATKEEIFETITVATTMGGTPALAESYRVIKLLEEQGKL